MKKMDPEIAEKRRKVAINAAAWALYGHDHKEQQVALGEQRKVELTELTAEELETATRVADRVLAHADEFTRRMEALDALKKP